MYDFLIALIFVAMVAGPAIIASIPKKESEDDV